MFSGTPSSEAQIWRPSIGLWLMHGNKKALLRVKKQRGTPLPPLMIYDLPSKIYRPHPCNDLPNDESRRARWPKALLCLCAAEQPQRGEGREKKSPQRRASHRFIHTHSQPAILLSIQPPPCPPCPPAPLAPQTFRSFECSHGKEHGTDPIFLSAVLIIPYLPPKHRTVAYSNEHLAKNPRINGETETCSARAPWDGLPVGRCEPRKAPGPRTPSLRSVVVI